MSQAKDLGKLILGLNPYTKRDMRDSDPVLVAGEMDIYCSSPSPGKDPPDVSQIEVELDGPYRQEWTFKGEPQRWVWLTVLNIGSPFTGRMTREKRPCVGSKTTC